MFNTPFRKIVRSSQWLYLVTFGGLALILLLGAALYAGGVRILDQEREKIDLDFFALRTYLGSQERFLHNLKIKNQRTETWSEAVKPIHSETSFAQDGRLIYQVWPALADVPYAAVCVDTETCSQHWENQLNSKNLHRLGDFLSDFYASHWARSYFPGTTTFLVDGTTSFGLMVPGFSERNIFDTFSPADILTALDDVLLYVKEQPQLEAVSWLPLKDFSNTMVGVVDVSLDSDKWLANDPDPNNKVYAATLFSQQRTNLFLNISDVPIYDGFWLLSPSGEMLLGEGQPLGSGKTGSRFGTQGIIWTLEDTTRHWKGVYYVKYSTLLQANMWLPITVSLLSVLFLMIAFVGMRWYNRRVINPAQLAHQALIDSEEFNRTLLETAPIALCVLTPEDGEIVFCNALAQEWLKLDLSNPVSYIPDGLLPSGIVKAEVSGTYASLHIHNHFFQVAYAPTRYLKKSVVLCAFSDISTRIQYEKALSQAKAEAISANQAKSRFLAAVSHEVRTPLYGILGTMELLAITNLSDGQRQHLSRLQHSALTLMQLISDILDVTKIEAGQLALTQEVFNPRHLVQECADNYAATAYQKGVVLFASIDRDVPAAVQGDASRIRQIMNNFLSNAIKFTFSGQIVVRLHCTRSSDARVNLVFQVADSGLGISAEDQKKLFLPFSQGSNTGLMSQGTGLGLSICDSLASLMGGTIRLTSEQGLGSSFSFDISLPTASETRPTVAPDLSGIEVMVRSPHAELSQNLSEWLTFWGAKATALICTSQQSETTGILLDVLADHPNPPADKTRPYMMAGLAKTANTAGYPFIDGYSPESIAAGLLSFFTKKQISNAPTMDQTQRRALHKHVLVAEDNPINQATIYDQLVQLGCTAVVVGDGREALGRWHQESFDVVLTDVNMPNMNGYEFAQALRKINTDIPIIGVTANAMRDEEDRCKAAGMSAWLVKPIDLKTLYQSLVSLSPDIEFEPDAIDDGSEDIPALFDEQELQILEELALLPDRYRELFHHSMRADAAVLLEAAQSHDIGAIKQRLHRMQGALLTMNQQILGQQVVSIKEGLQVDAEAGCAAAADFAMKLDALITQHLPV